MKAKRTTVRFWALLLAALLVIGASPIAAAPQGEQAPPALSEGADADDADDGEEHAPPPASEAVNGEEAITADPDPEPDAPPADDLPPTAPPERPDTEHGEETPPDAGRTTANAVELPLQGGILSGSVMSEIEQTITVFVNATLPEEGTLGTWYFKIVDYDTGAGPHYGPVAVEIDRKRVEFDMERVTLSLGRYRIAVSDQEDGEYRNFSSFTAYDSNLAELREIRFDNGAGEPEIDHENRTIHLMNQYSAASSASMEFWCWISEGAHYELNGQIITANGSRHDFREPVTLTLVSANGLVRNEYVITVENRPTDGIYLEDVKLTHPARRNHGMWGNEWDPGQAKVYFGRNNEIYITPEFRLREEPLELYDQQDWTLELSINEWNAKIRMPNGELIAPSQFDRNLLLQGPVDITLVSYYDAEVTRDYTLILQNARSWVSEYVEELEPQNNWVISPGSYDTQRYVEVIEQARFYMVGITVDLHGDRIADSYPELGEIDLSGAGYRLLFLDVDHEHDRESRALSFREGGYIEFDGQGRPRRLDHHISTTDLRPGYYELILEIYEGDEEPEEDDEDVLRIPLGGLTFGDPDYIPFVEMPAHGNVALSPAAPTPGSRDLGVSFELYDTEVPQVLAELIRTPGNVRVASQVVDLTGDSDVRRGEARFQTPSLTAGNYLVRISLNPGRWHAVLVEEATIHTFAVAASDDALRMNSFSIQGTAGEIDHSAGAITLSLLENVDKTSLSPVFSVPTGSSVWVGESEQISGASTQDFSGPVVYTVRGEQGGRKDYTVTVTWQPARGDAQLTRFAAFGREAEIDHEALTASIHLDYAPGINLSAVYVSFGLSMGASSVPDSRVQQVMDFSGGPQTITVTAEDRQTVNPYTVSVTMEPASEENELLSLSASFAAVIEGRYEFRDYEAEIDHEANTATLYLPNNVHVISSNRTTFTIPQYATASLTSGDALDYTEPFELTITAQSGAARTYTVIAEIDTEEEMVAVYGSVAMLDAGQRTPVTNQPLLLYNNKQEVLAELTTDGDGRFRYELPQSQQVNVYIATRQEFGTLLLSSYHGYVTTSYERLDPWTDHSLEFANGEQFGSYEIRGRVVDPFGAGIPDASIQYQSELTRTGGDGSFRFGIDARWMNIHTGSFTVQKTGYRDARFNFSHASGTVFRQMLLYGYIDVGNVVMTPVAPADEIPLDNWSLRVMPEYAMRGEAVEINLHYTPGALLENAELRIEFPAGLEYQAASNPDAEYQDGGVVLSGPFAAGQEHKLLLRISAPLDYDPDSFTVTASLTVDGQVHSLGSATVMLMGLTIQIPGQVGIDMSGHSHSFDIRGRAIADDGYHLDFEITDDMGNPAQTNVSLTGRPTSGVGPWYTVNGVRVQNAGDVPGLYTVTARLIGPDGAVVDQAQAQIDISYGALTLTRIHLTSKYVNAPAPQPVTNSSYVTASLYVDEFYQGEYDFTIDTEWENSESIEYGYYILANPAGNRITLENRPALRDEGLFSATFEKGTYSGMGESYLYFYAVHRDGEVSDFHVATITLLIDPSGYVYDADTRERIEGATAVLEVLRDGAWEVWEAEAYGQHNHQTTDALGRYGWYVPNGDYRVLIYADGYLDYRTDLDEQYGVITVLPPRLDINIALQRIPGDTVTLSHLELGGAFRTAYAAGEALSLDGLVVTAHYSDGSAKPVSDYLTTPAAGAGLTAADRQVIVRYTEDGVTRATSYAITVSGSTDSTPSRSGRSGNGGSNIAATAASLATASVPTATAPCAGPVQSGVARALVAQAVQAAPGAGTVTVTIQNADLLAHEVAREMVMAAGSARLRVRADTKLNSGAVDVRLTFWADDLSGALNLRASTRSAQAGRIRALFRTWFANKHLMVMSMEERGALGVEAEAAFLLDETLRGASTLYLYRYNQQTNRYQALPGRKDENGYLHFQTASGGDYVVSDQPLTLR